MGTINDNISTFGTNTELNILTLSDIHLGHHNTRTEDIIERLNDMIPDNLSTRELDIIFLAGDIFDTLLMHNEHEVLLIQAWIIRLLRLCAKWDIVLKVLEGTPSHDRNQNKHFVALNESNEIGADVEYADTLSIRYIERFNINVLYVPDEWDNDPNDTWLAVTDLLRKHGLDKVDFAVMHGMFEYQLPKGIIFPHHLSERYLSIVKHYIWIGHVHHPSQHDRILVPGSFDRLMHNEEEPKGCWFAKVTGELQNDILEHRENKSATIYRTLDCRELTLDESLILIKAHSSIPMYSNIRIHCLKGSEIASSIGLLRVSYPGIYFKFKIDKVVVGLEDTIDLGEKYTAVELTPLNIKTMLMETIHHETNDPVLLNKVNELLDGVI